jgi:hypothetical protein
VVCQEIFGKRCILLFSSLLQCRKSAAPNSGFNHLKQSDLGFGEKPAELCFNGSLALSLTCTKFAWTVESLLIDLLYALNRVQAGPQSPITTHSCPFTFTPTNIGDLWHMEHTHTQNVTSIPKLV